MFNFFKTRADLPVMDASPDKIRSIYRKYQWQVFLGLVLGYAMFYVVRMSLNVVKKPMLDAGIVTLEELGVIGSAFLFTYAVGKFSNGFLSDYANIGRFMSVSLGLSSICTILMGMNTATFFLVLMWGLNGWFQSVGSAPSCVSIFQWFSPKQRGSVYSIWGGSRNIGEGISWILTASVVSFFGWKAGFIGAGLASLAAALCMYLVLKDRPQTYALPEPAVAFGEQPEITKKVEPAEIRRAQLFVLKQPTVWLIAAACACMYMSRYAMSSWAVLYLQEQKGYNLIDAGFAMSAYPIAGFLGAILAGIISDKMFNANRHIPTLLYGLANIAGMCLMFWGPQSRMMDAVALALIGYAIGGLVVFLAGLTACDLMPKTAVGAVKGFIGLCSYIAASCQELVSAALIKTSVVDGVTHYDFSSAQYFWLGASVVSMLLALTVWNAKKVVEY
ncbi:MULTISPECIES: MFS transporter [Aeromonas]|jgi:OPA family sugar phosphate sensor protein UhpC-like MFS transporter|uniref:MFS transporter n=2 Tax=Aeromonas veronii TaxID=654 RepID=A0A2K8MVB4_AERVE|nr:MFS transporter [Aeromonas veronii]MCR6550729.1 MFS transporter [Aeromonas sp. CPF2-S1]HDT6079519.1 MFS transporter [Aeromonas veronii bv. veronii]ATY79420.1 MFS transporter [Aeromonas veronii]AXV21197.1 MFS transporter [Aeromonas veronii]MBA2796889.1 MFS transporter [Aeromonas veronii]